MRKFSIEGEVYTLLEYGKMYLEKYSNESNDPTLNPANLSSEEIQKHALEFLEDRMYEDESVFEIE